MKLIRGRIDAEHQRASEQSAHKDKADANNHNDNTDILTSFEGHVKLGAPCPLKTIQQIVHDHHSDPAFGNFKRKFTTFVNQCLPVYLERDPNSWDMVSFPETFQVCFTTTTHHNYFLSHSFLGGQLQEHKYLKVHYESKMDWRQVTDHLRCNPMFHGKPRYDSLIFQSSPDEFSFARLVFMFSCSIPLFGTYDFALVRPFTANVSPARKSFDESFRITRVKARPCAASIFIPIRSIVRGTLLYPDPKHADEYLVVDHIDGDMFLRMKEWASRR